MTQAHDPGRVEKPTAYRRVDTASLHTPASANPALSSAASAPQRVRWFVLPLALIGVLFQGAVTVMVTHVSRVPVAGTLIPILGLALLLATAGVINPLLARLRWRHAPRPFNRAEVLTLFVAVMVSSGVFTLGLADQLVPLVAAPFNPDWNLPQRGWNERVVPALHPALYINDPQVILDFRRGLADPPTADAGLIERLHTYGRAAGRVPWSVWIKPLSCWLALIAATYLMFYSLAYLVLPVWSREQLAFPLAQLPDHLLPEADGAGAASPPAMLRSIGFWVGFAVSFLVLGWNACVRAGWLVGVSAIELGMPEWVLTPLLGGTMLHGLGGAPAFLVVFTCIGLAFLLPTEMSFSVWFYYLLGRAMLFIAVLAGYGLNAYNFPSDGLSLSNPLTAQGGGAMAVFASVTLARCLWDRRRLSREHPWPQRLRASWPVLTLVLAMAIMAGWLRWCGISVGWTIALVISMLLLAVGFMRIVAQSGLYWLQSHTGLFHLHRLAGLGRLASSPSLVQALSINSVLFMDIRCLLAPNLLHAARLFDQCRCRRGHAHWTVGASLVIAVFGALAMALVMAYAHGADNLHPWYYTTFPQSTLDAARHLTTTPPAVSPGLAAFFVGGGLWTLLSGWLRQSFFWIPHPIGYIMLVVPLLNQLWFSFFLAWLVKKPLVRLGGKWAYERARTAAVGLIAGELVAIAVWALVQALTGVGIPYVHLNRYGA